MKTIITEQQNYLIKCLMSEEIKFKRHLFLEFYNRVPYFKEYYLTEIHGYIQDNDIIDIIIEDIKEKGLPYKLSKDIFDKKYFFDRIELSINVVENNLLSDIKIEGGYQPHKSGIFKDGESVWNLLKNTQSYKKYLFLENFVKQLYITSKEEQEKIIEDYNESNGTNIKSFEKLLKIINNKWYKYKKKYINTACKIAYDLFLENKLIIN